MLSAPTGGLWHCLSTSFQNTQWSYSRSAIYFLNAPYSVLQRSYTLCAKGSANSPCKLPHSKTFRPPSSFPSLNSGQRRHNRQPYVRSDRSIQSLYGDLRQASKKADYQLVQQLARLLVNQRGEKPSQRLYHALVLANADPEHGSPREVEALLQEMVDMDIALDAATYHAALKALAIHPDYLLRSEILEELHQRWFALTVDGWHDVIAGLLRDRQLEVALNNLELLHNQSVPIQPWLYDIVVYTLCNLGEFDEALKLMSYRVSIGEHSISPGLWSHFLDTASRSLHHDATVFTWRIRVESGYLNPSSGMCINVLNTAARRGDAHLAADVFRVLGGRRYKYQLHHYEALLETWLGSGDLKAAFSVLSSLTSTSKPPSEISTRAIYVHLVEHYDRIPEALEMLRSLYDSGKRIPHAAVNCIIEAYIHHSDLASAIEAYQTLHSIIPSGPNTATFNTLFRGCSYARRKDLAMFLASEMLALNVPPNALTYDRLILVCLNEAGDKVEGFRDAWKYFLEMKSMGWWPRGGTLKTLGIRGCVLADKRVMELVDARRGLSEKRMEYLTWMYWGKDRPSADHLTRSYGAEDEYEESDPDKKAA